MFHCMGGMGGFGAINMISSIFMVMQMMQVMQAVMGHMGQSSIGNLTGSHANLQSLLYPNQGPFMAGGTPTPLTGAPSGPAGDIGNINLEGVLSQVPADRRDAAREHFPYILAECKRQGITNKGQIAYILATSVHESNAGGAMEEFACGSAYEGRSDLGNTQSGDGRRFKGRGYVQITGRRNYQDWSNRLGIDLVNNPDACKDPRVAARVLVEGMMKGTFTGRGLGDYINGSQTDFHNARRTVNGTDRAGLIAGYAQNFMSAL